MVEGAILGRGDIGWPRGGGAVVSHRGPLPSKCQGPIGEGFVVRGKGESVATRAATLGK